MNTHHKCSQWQNILLELLTKQLILYLMYKTMLKQRGCFVPLTYILTTSSVTGGKHMEVFSVRKAGNKPVPHIKLQYIMVACAFNFATGVTIQTNIIKTSTINC